jgi:hypothetical protein
VLSLKLSGVQQFKRAAMLVVRFFYAAKSALRHFLKIANADVSQLEAQLGAHHELWDQHTIRKTAPNTPHSGMTDIWVRYNDAKKYEESGDYRTFNDAHAPVWHSAWTVLPSLKPIVMNRWRLLNGWSVGCKCEGTWAERALV